MYTLGKKINDEGVWKDYSGARLKIGRAGSVEFLKAQEALERPYRKKIDRGTLSATVKRDINIRALARAILLDWDGVQDGEGNQVAYVEDIGVEALLNDPDLLEFVMDIAMDNANFAVEQEQAIVKKSKPRKIG